MSKQFPYSPARFPAIPAVTVTLRSPDGTQAIAAVLAQIDTAADRTLVPLSLLQQLGLSPLRRITARGLGSIAQPVDEYEVDVEIPGVAIVSTKVITHPSEPFVLIGREILNLFRVTFDGPNQVVEFH